MPHKVEVHGLKLVLYEVYPYLTFIYFCHYFHHPYNFPIWAKIITKVVRHLKNFQYNKRMDWCKDFHPIHRAVQHRSLPTASNIPINHE